MGEADPSQDCVMASRGDTCAVAGWWVTLLHVTRDTCCGRYDMDCGAETAVWPATLCRQHIHALCEATRGT